MPMKVFFNDQIENLISLVEKCAKYQKVLLVYSAQATDSKILDIYNAIKDSVIFNKVDSKLFTNDLVSDGYRMIIFLTTGIELTRFKYNTQDFINVYLPINNEVLPFYYIMGDTEGYILFEERAIDLNIYSFLYFHGVLDYLSELKAGNSKILLPAVNTNYSLESSLELLNNSNLSSFVDLEFIVENDLEYSALSYIHIFILDGLMQFVTSVNNKELQMIDVYKYHGDDNEMIDRLYKIYSNYNYFKLLKLNFNQILNKIGETKRNIIFLIDNSNFSNELNYDDLMNKLKNFCSKKDELIELYLYDIFAD